MYLGVDSVDDTRVSDGDKNGAGVDIVLRLRQKVGGDYLRGAALSFSRFKGSRAKEREVSTSEISIFM